MAGLGGGVGFGWGGEDWVEEGGEVDAVEAWRRVRREGGVMRCWLPVGR